MFVSLWSATCCKDQYSQKVLGQSGWVCLFHYGQLHAAKTNILRLLGQSSWVCLFHNGQPHAVNTNILRKCWVNLVGYVCFTMVSHMPWRPVFSMLGQSGWVCLFHCGQLHAAKTSILRQCWVSLAGYVCFTMVSYILQRPVFSNNVGSVWLFTHFEWKYLADRHDITAVYLLAIFWLILR